MSKLNIFINLQGEPLCLIDIYYNSGKIHADVKLHDHFNNDQLLLVKKVIRGLEIKQLTEIEA